MLVLKQLIFIVLALICQSLAMDCDGAKYLAPCECGGGSGENIFCDSPAITADILVDAFQNYSQSVGTRRTFDTLYVRSPSLTELPAEAFAGIQFRHVFIRNTYALRHIHSEAFAGTESYIKYLEISGAPELDPSAGPNHQLFAAINALKVIKTLRITNTSLSYIPRFAFKSLSGLRDLYLDGNQLERIEGKAFRDLHNVNILDLSNNRIKYVSDGAFDLNLAPPVAKEVFKKLDFPGMVGVDSTIQPLYLRLGGNRLKDQSLSGRTLSSGSKRSVIVSLEGNDVTYLSKHSFQLFLLSHSLNKVADSIDCESCDNYWLTDTGLTANNTEFITCLGGQPLSDPGNFQDC